MPNVLSPRDLVFRPDNMDETVPHATNYTVYVAKTKVLISFTDRTAKLICAYSLAYTKSRSSHAAQLSISLFLIGDFFYTAVVLIHTKQGNKSDIVRGIARQVLNRFKTIL